MLLCQFELLSVRQFFVDQVSKRDNSYCNKYYGAGQGVGVFG